MTEGKRLSAVSLSIQSGDPCTTFDAGRRLQEEVGVDWMYEGLAGKHHSYPLPRVDGGGQPVCDDEHPQPSPGSHREGPLERHVGVQGELKAHYLEAEERMEELADRGA